jgi:hypothetical protein
MMKKSSSGVLASLPGTVKRETRVSRGVAALLGQGASQRAGVGRVRILAFLSMLQECFPVVPHVQTIEILVYQHSLPAAC